MSRRIFTLFSIFVILSVALGACNFPTAGGNAGNPNQVATSAAQTVQAQLTKAAFETVVAQLTKAVETTATPQPATATQRAPTQAPTATRMPPTAVPIPCNWAQFVKDVTIPDGTKVTPGQAFTKTWRIKNVGTCTWTDEYMLVFDSGNAMGAPAKQSLDDTVAPGETIDISVKLTAPDENGDFKGNFKLRSANGITFGIGANASMPFYVEVEVVKPKATHNPDSPINFIKEYCSATWTTPNDTLPCPGPADDFTNGSVRVDKAPKLEGGYQDDEPALITIPSSGSSGRITGKFQPFYVQAGDQFTAVIGCLDKSPSCDVTFELRYVVGSGTSTLLESWDQVSDGAFDRVTVDLTDLDGQLVHLLLVVRNNGSSKDDRAFWMAPAITR